MVTVVISLFHRLQCPNTFHYVLTLEHAIAEGHHYYPISSIQATCHHVVHSFIRKFTITNQLHPSAYGLLRRLLTANVNWYMSNYAPEGHINPVFCYLHA
jgi:hypothetical protein